MCSPPLFVGQILGNLRAKCIPSPSVQPPQPLKGATPPQLLAKETAHFFDQILWRLWSKEIEP